MTEKDKNIQCRKRQKREVKDYIPSEDWNQEAKIQKKKMLCRHVFVAFHFGST